MRHAFLGLLLLGCSTAPVVAPAAPASIRPAAGLEVEPISGLGFFADERARSQLLLTNALTARDAGLLPAEVTQRAWAMAAEGRNPLTGATCGKPLSRYEARKRWGAALGVTGTAGGNVWCQKDGGCELSVYGRPLDDDDRDDRFKLVAPVSREGDALSALTAAVKQLGPPAPDAQGGGLGILGGMGKSAPLQEEDRLEVRAWLADSRDSATVDDAQQAFPALTVAQVATCASPTDTGMSLLVEVSAAGSISRCEGQSYEDPAMASCACGQLQRVAPAPWLSGKRWSVSLHIDRRDQTTSDRRLVLSGSWNTYLKRIDVPGQKYPRFKPKVEDPSLEGWTPGPARLATGCFVNAFPEPGQLNSRWAVWFDAAGRPKKVLEQKGFDPLPKELAACVWRALNTAQSPCPSRAGLWAMADFHVSARDPNAPQKSLNDLLQSKP